MSQKKLKRERAANREKMKLEIQQRLEKKKIDEIEKDSAKEISISDKNKEKIKDIKEGKAEKTEKIEVTKEIMVEKPKEKKKEEKREEKKEEKKEHKNNNNKIEINSVEQKELNPIFKIDFSSIEEAEEYKRISKGREFCKIGCRIQDILDEEIENYKYENEKNIFSKIFKYKEARRRKKLAAKMQLIEDRRTSNTRKLIYSFIRADERNANLVDDSERLLKLIKKELLEQVREYEKIKKNG